MKDAPGVVIDRVGVTLGSHPVFGNLGLQLQGGQWHAVLGRSGIGKTTLVRLLAGVQVADSGTVRADDGAPLASRVACMSQDDGLLPWLSVIDNIQLGPRLRGQRSAQTRKTAQSLLQQVGMADWELALPASLSGGMRQRVALARTLLEARPVVVMDEPFSRLDAITRDELQNLAFSLLQSRTVLLVTHDPVEALRLARHLHVLQRGSPAQVDSLQMEPCDIPRPIDDPILIARLSELWLLLKLNRGTAELRQSA